MTFKEGKRALDRCPALEDPDMLVGRKDREALSCTCYLKAPQEEAQLPTSPPRSLGGAGAKPHHTLQGTVGAEGRQRVPQHWVQLLCATEAHLPPGTTQILWWRQKLVLSFLVAPKRK